VVVVDVLRATTTMVYALAAGATMIVPCREVDDARQRARNFPGALLGGEREGLPIDGFDLGNSPAEYQADKIAGRPIVLTTTNGTRAIDSCHMARRVLFAALVNRSAVCRQLEREPRVGIICAGTNGQVTSEDVLLAGAIVEGFSLSDADELRCNDQAWLARAAWRSLSLDPPKLPALIAALRDSTGGRNLVRLGMEADIELAALCDRFAVVPALDIREGVIRLQ
jgi:2-phosphosulfolactate phosphatase